MFITYLTLNTLFLQFSMLHRMKKRIQKKWRKKRVIEHHVCFLLFFWFVVVWFGFFFFKSLTYLKSTLLFPKEVFNLSVFCLGCFRICLLLCCPQSVTVIRSLLSYLFGSQDLRNSWLHNLFLKNYFYFHLELMFAWSSLYQLCHLC